ncbi:Inner membrane protein YhcB [Candidatus Erwinia haradaeae]|uniref:Z-ring associated protein G n=1 Tax=Candidatus Erwinia haradaeae TaxID=1922217 RepID=A0A451D7L7_9GAMM|nr:Inner membrane protein YhcB [Candidatus Erwinia haradaeae]
MMMWEIAVSGLVIGIIIGVFAMCFGGRNLHEKKKLEDKLKQSQVDLMRYREELRNYLAQSLHLLDNLECDHKKLHQHIKNGSNVLLSHLVTSKSLYRYDLAESEVDKNQVPINFPRDYPEESKNVFSKPPFYTPLSK